MVSAFSVALKAFELGVPISGLYLRLVTVQLTVKGSTARAGVGVRAGGGATTGNEINGSGEASSSLHGVTDQNNNQSI